MKIRHNLARTPRCDGSARMERMEKMSSGYPDGCAAGRGADGAARRPCQAGIMLVECMVYIAVFFILSGVAMTAFYFCWDGTHTTIKATDDIEAALQAGERWRADVREASGMIKVDKTESGETVTIPESGQDVIYKFEGDELLRQTAVLVRAAKSSEMTTEVRGGVTAWRWELELTPGRKNIHMPFLFTFEAAQKTK